MLEGKGRISRNEHRAIFALALFAFGLRIVQFFIAVVFAEPHAGTNFPIYSIFEMEEFMSPIYSFLVFGSVTCLIWKLTTTRVIVSAFLLSLLSWYFVSWFVEAQQAIARAKAVRSEAGLIDYDPVLGWGSHYDAVTFAAVIVLLIWSLSTLVRLLPRRPLA